MGLADNGFKLDETFVGLPCVFVSVTSGESDKSRHDVGRIFSGFRFRGCIFCFCLEARHKPEREEGHRGKYNCYVVSPKTDGSADSSGCPKTCSSRRSANACSADENCATADEADAVDQTFNDPRCGFGVAVCNSFGSLNEATGRNRDERKRSKAGASFVSFSIPSDWQRQNIGDQEHKQMSDQVKS